MLLQIPDVLKPEELESLRRLLAKERFEDGGLTASPAAQGSKHNLQAPQSGEASRQGGPIVLNALRRSSLFFSAALPKRIQGPLFNRYDTGMRYDDHMDTAVIQGSSLMRSDVAATLFLTPPNEYDGGELVIQDSFGAHRVKLPAGSMIVYPASSVHRVEEVTRGTRLAAVLWVESLVRDESRRRILFDIDLVIGSLTRNGPGNPDAARLGSAYHNLLRAWAET
jgi:PKHD-type hydroxylase